MCFTITGSNLNTSLVKPVPFASGELYVTEVKNEEGYSSYEFKNKQGQVILTRQLNNGTAHDTYYVYDDLIIYLMSFLPCLQISLSKRINK